MKEGLTCRNIHFDLLGCLRASHERQVYQQLSSEEYGRIGHSKITPEDVQAPLEKSATRVRATEYVPYPPEALGTRFEQT